MFGVGEVAAHYLQNFREVLAPPGDFNFELDYL